MALNSRDFISKNAILVYSTLIYTCKYKQLNFTRYASNNSTVVQGYENKSSIFLEKYKISLKKCKDDWKRKKYRKTWK